MATESYMGSEEAKGWETGYTEFTVKLITDTFDALVAANIRQTETYMELVKQLAKDLETYIKDTKDDIGGEMILQFLGTVLNSDAAKVNPSDPPVDPARVVKKEGGEALTTKQATALTNAVRIDDTISTPTISEGNVDAEKFKIILDAVASKIAADKYTMLKEMVKMGVLRIVVEHGIIETRLTINTSKSSYHTANASNYHRDSFDFRAAARTGGFLSRWVKASASTSYSNLNINTSSRTDRDISGSQVQIYGYVRIDFKTDYQPLKG
ncbi:MAG: hypothetical protein CVT88_06910 [Candidatus Altiarchaeales archaeon HGW-Altiarchaeales-1]|nr:MAG: hypothetical protein CVT88_06910 [Candidatus Altiarchaeales archaeon HGW-Altiarchaeales-1]